MIKTKFHKKKPKKNLKKNKTLTTLINTEEEEKYSPLLELSQDNSSVPFHSFDPLKRHHTWSTEFLCTNHGDASHVNIMHCH
jgi:hypothetical protein